MPEDYRELFGNKVKELRKQLGLTQEQVAGAMGMDLTSINEIENGHRNPTLHTLIKLAEVLDVKPAQLIEEI